MESESEPHSRPQNLQAQGERERERIITDKTSKVCGSIYMHVYVYLSTYLCMCPEAHRNRDGCSSGTRW